MKKLLVLLATVFLLAACGGNEEPVSNTEKAEPTNQGKTEPTQDELNAKLKEDAITLGFVEANGNEVAEGTKVTITGEVTDIANGDIVGGEFTVTTKENDGFGIYTINNFSMEKVEKGSTITVYGTYDGKDATSIPLITVTVIE